MRTTLRSPTNAVARSPICTRRCSPSPVRTSRSASDGSGAGGGATAPAPTARPPPPASASRPARRCDRAVARRRARPPRRRRRAVAPPTAASGRAATGVSARSCLSRSNVARAAGERARERLGLGARRAVELARFQRREERFGFSVQFFVHVRPRFGGPGNRPATSAARRARDAAAAHRAHVDPDGVGNLVVRQLAELAQHEVPRAARATRRRAPPRDDGAPPGSSNGAGATSSSRVTATVGGRRGVSAARRAMVRIQVESAAGPPLLNDGSERATRTKVSCSASSAAASSPSMRRTKA